MSELDLRSKQSMIGLILCLNDENSNKNDNESGIDNLESVEKSLKFNLLTKFSCVHSF